MNAKHDRKRTINSILHDNFIVKTGCGKAYFRRFHNTLRHSMLHFTL